jgi:Co/Zn/Cd efflux system component
METVPSGIDIDELKKKIVDENRSVINSIEKFNLWQLTGKHILVTAHLECVNSNNNPGIEDKINGSIKAYLLQKEIHAELSTTFQFKFDDGVFHEFS